jgi:hypothetical protein
MIFTKKPKGRNRFVFDLFVLTLFPVRARMRTGLVFGTALAYNMSPVRKDGGVCPQR